MPCKSWKCSASPRSDRRSPTRIAGLHLSQSRCVIRLTVRHPRGATSLRRPMFNLFSKEIEMGLPVQLEGSTEHRRSSVRRRVLCGRHSVRAWRHVRHVSLRGPEQCTDPRIAVRAPRTTHWKIAQMRCSHGWKQAGDVPVVPMRPVLLQRCRQAPQRRCIRRHGRRLTRACYRVSSATKACRHPSRGEGARMRMPRTP